MLAEVTSPAGQKPYPIELLVDLVKDPAMSLPSPLTPDELPKAG